MITFVKKYLLDNWQNLELGEKPEDLLFIKFPDRRIRSPEVGIISFLVEKVVKGKEEPLLILRFPRYFGSEEASSSLELEHQSLSKIHEKIKTDIIPKPLVWATINEHKVLAINFLAGESLSKNMLAGNIFENYVKNFSLAFPWLVNFQKDMGAEGETSAEEIVAKTINEYLRLFPRNRTARGKYFAKLIEKAKGFSGKKIPLYAQHGDFHAENIFVIEGKVSGVIDWEDFELQGVPCFDLYHFIKTYFEALFDHCALSNDLSLIEKLSLDREVLKLIKSTETQYLQAIGVDQELRQIFLPLYLIRSAAVAGSPRKMALGVLKRLELLLKMDPFTLEDLFLDMSIFAYFDLSKNAAAAGNKELANLCRSKIAAIQKKMGS